MPNSISSQYVAPVKQATNSASQSGSVTRSAANITQAVVEQASVSLGSDLGSATATTSAGQFTLTLAQILQSTTSVDPSTGQSEIADAANVQLQSALSAFLVASGFSEQQAAESSSGVFENLSATGEVHFSTSFDNTTNVGSSSTEAYAQQSSSTSAIVLSQRSGSISIGIDLDTGQLNVSLTEGSGSSYGLVVQSNGPVASVTAALDNSGGVPDALDTSQLTNTPNPGSAQPSPLSESSCYSYVATQQSTSSSNDGQSSIHSASTESGDESSSYDAGNEGDESALKSPASLASGNSNFDSLDWLNANLSPPKFYVGDTVSNDLMRMASSLHQPDAATSSSDQTQIKTGPFSVEVGFSQMLSVQQLDDTGHGITIFKRPDGTVGAMTSHPVHLSA